MGRKDKYYDFVQPRLKEIRQWYGVLTEAQICEQLGVTQASFCKYKKEHEELAECLRGGKAALIADLKATLKRKAKGFRYREIKTTTKTVDGVTAVITEEFRKYSAPDTGAIHLLLKNLDETWRNDDKTTVDLKRDKLEFEKEKYNEGW